MIISLQAGIDIPCGDVEEAIEARKKAENEYYGEFSYDNSQKTQLFLLPVKENK